MKNLVILIGRVGKNPELHTTENGKQNVKFTLATWDNVKDETHESGWRQITEWHNIIVWGDSAKYLAEKIKPGMLVAVEGSIKNHTYEKDGQTKYISEIVGNAKIIPQKVEKSESKPEVKNEVRDIPKLNPSDDLPF